MLLVGFGENKCFKHYLKSLKEENSPNIIDNHDGCFVLHDAIFSAYVTLNYTILYMYIICVYMYIYNINDILTSKFANVSHLS